MSKISELIFKGAKHYITSPYGSRNTINTSSGKTSSFHNGTDYGTNGEKLPQYAIEDGYVFTAAKASDGAKYVWVIYPRVKLALLHYHLDKYSVSDGQVVSKGTLLGYTGKTGKATGIHLHLGIKHLNDLSSVRIEKMTWDALRSCDYTDPEKVKYSEPVAKSKYVTGKYVVTASLLRVRKGAGTSYDYLKFDQLSNNAKDQIRKNNNGKAADGLVKGCTCSATKISGCWGKIPSGWVCLKYCKKV